MTSPVGMPTQKTNKSLQSIGGFTLIEILIVIFIIATMMGLALGLFGGGYRIHAKKEVTHLISSIQYTYNQAITQNLYYRLVFDFENQSYWIESSQNPFYVTTPEQDEEAAKKKSVFDEDETPDPHAPNFTLDDEGVVRKVNINQSVKLRDVYVAHQEVFVNEGFAYLYFFPKGLTESAIIRFTNDEDGEPYSIIVSSITGHCQVVRDLVDENKMNEDKP